MLEDEKNEINLQILPREILFNIFAYLSFQDLSSCSIVNKYIHDLAEGVKQDYEIYYPLIYQQQALSHSSSNAYSLIPAALLYEDWEMALLKRIREGDAIESEVLSARNFINLAYKGCLNGVFENNKSLKEAFLKNISIFIKNLESEVNSSSEQKISNIDQLCFDLFRLYILDYRLQQSSKDEVEQQAKKQVVITGLGDFLVFDSSLPHANFWKIVHLISLSDPDLKTCSTARNGLKREEITCQLDDHSKLYLLYICIKQDNPELAEVIVHMMGKILRDSTSTKERNKAVIFKFFQKSNHDVIECLIKSLAVFPYYYYRDEKVRVFINKIYNLRDSQLKFLDRALTPLLDAMQPFSDALPKFLLMDVLSSATHTLDELLDSNTTTYQKRQAISDFMNCITEDETVKILRWCCGVSLGFSGGIFAGILVNPIIAMILLGACVGFIYGYFLMYYIYTFVSFCLEDKESRERSIHESTMRKQIIPALHKTGIELEKALLPSPSGFFSKPKPQLQKTQCNSFFDFFNSGQEDDPDMHLVQFCPIQRF